MGKFADLAYQLRGNKAPGATPPAPDDMMEGEPPAEEAACPKCGYAGPVDEFVAGPSGEPCPPGSGHCNEGKIARK